MKLERGVSYQTRNLAELLEGNEGTFVCIQSGQAHIVETAPGHSIVSGPTPIGPRANTVPMALGAEAEPWSVVKVGDTPFGFQERERQQQSQPRRQQA